MRLAGPASAMATEPRASEFRRVARDPLPIPRFSPGPRPSATGVPRGTLQRRRRAWGEQRDVFQCLGAINSLYTGSEDLVFDSLDDEADWASSSSFLSEVQSAMTQRITASVAALGPAPHDLNEAEALEKLRLGARYGDSGGSPAPYEASRVSLPEDKAEPVSLARLWGDGGEAVVADFIGTKILPGSTASENLRESKLKRPYGDPRLKGRRNYEDFVLRLWRAGMLEFTLDRGTEVVDCFFVRKSNGMQRLVIDCRRSNCHFAQPGGSH